MTITTQPLDIAVTIDAEDWPILAAHLAGTALPEDPWTSPANAHPWTGKLAQVNDTTDWARHGRIFTIAAVDRWTRASDAAGNYSIPTSLLDIVEV